MKKIDGQHLDNFAQALQMVIAKALQTEVPLDFVIARLEIIKTDIANRYLNEQMARQANELADQISKTTPRIIGPGQN